MGNLDDLPGFKALNPTMAKTRSQKSVGTSDQIL